MAGASSLYGVIDIGSNSVRMVVYNLAQDPPSHVFNEKVFCGLARDIDKTGRLNTEAVTEALEGLLAYKKVIEQYGLSHFQVVGTAALRDALDGAEFVNRVTQDIGLDIRIIDGHEEARYAALGVLALNSSAEGLVADFGGGSLEFARIENGRIDETLSRPYGAYRVLAMADAAQNQLGAGLAELIPRYGQACSLHVIGGSWRALAQAYAQEQGLTPVTMQDYTVGRNDMSAFCAAIKDFSPEEFRHRYAFEEKRAALAPVSAFVLRQVLDILQPAQMIVSLAGIRDGILYDFLHPPTKFTQNM